MKGFLFFFFAMEQPIAWFMGVSPSPQGVLWDSPVRTSPIECGQWGEAVPAEPSLSFLDTQNCSRGRVFLFLGVSVPSLQSPPLPPPRFAPPRSTSPHFSPRRAQTTLGQHREYTDIIQASRDGAEKAKLQQNCVCQQIQQSQQEAPLGARLGKQSRSGNIGSNPAWRSPRDHRMQPIGTGRHHCEAALSPWIDCRKQMDTCRVLMGPQSALGGAPGGLWGTARSSRRTSGSNRAPWAASGAHSEASRALKSASGTSVRALVPHRACWVVTAFS